MTYTVANLELSASAYQEIKTKLEKAGYQHAFMPGGGIDMTGIAVIPERQIEQNIKTLWGLPVHVTEEVHTGQVLVGDWPEVITAKANLHDLLPLKIHCDDCSVEIIADTVNDCLNFIHNKHYKHHCWIEAVPCVPNNQLTEEVNV
jgi:hypothetical protein